VRPGISCEPLADGLASRGLEVIVVGLDPRFDFYASAEELGEKSALLGSGDDIVRDERFFGA
jgi:hypothetical protein